MQESTSTENKTFLAVISDLDVTNNEIEQVLIGLDRYLSITKETRERDLLILDMMKDVLMAVEETDATNESISKAKEGLEQAEAAALRQANRIEAITSFISKITTIIPMPDYKSKSN